MTINQLLHLTEVFYKMATQEYESDEEEQEQPSEPAPLSPEELEYLARIIAMAARENAVETVRESGYKGQYADQHPSYYRWLIATVDSILDSENPYTPHLMKEYGNRFQNDPEYRYLSREERDLIRGMAISEGELQAAHEEARREREAAAAAVKPSKGKRQVR
jgi:hypothetical protein